MAKRSATKRARSSAKHPVELKRSGFSFRQADLETIAHALAVGPEAVAACLQELRRRGLVVKDRQRQLWVAFAGPRRAVSDLERRLTCYLLGFQLTDSSFIIRRGPEPGCVPVILTTRIPVEAIAAAFDAGQGLTDIQEDFPVLRREEIEAAIQYYLNHHREIREAMARSEQMWAEATGMSLSIPYQAKWH